jgi:hypothetical protein
MNNSSSKSAGDIFDRLFKTDTYATNAMKRKKYVKPNEEPPKKPAGITTVSKNLIDLAYEYNTPLIQILINDHYRMLSLIARARPILTQRRI